MAAKQWLVLVLFAGATSANLGAAEPEIRGLNVRGLQVGGTTTLVLDGASLGTALRLLLPFPVKQVLKPGATAARATFEVTLGSDVQPGYYQAARQHPQESVCRW